MDGFFWMCASAVAVGFVIAATVELVRGIRAYRRAKGEMNT